MAIDDSSASRHALAAATDLARHFSWKLVLVHAFALEAPTSAAALAKLEAERSEKLARQGERLRRQGIDVKTLTGQGVVHDVVIREAQAAHAQLIIVGTAGRRGLRRLLAGSIAHSIIRVSPLPVLVAPTRNDPRRRHRGPVVAAVDFTASSRTVLDAAATLARQQETRVELVHSIALPTAMGDFMGSATPIAYLLAPDTSVAQAKADALTRRTRAAAVETALVLGDPARAIVERAKDVDARAIVVGRHGRRFGSVSSAIVRMADRPVLIVPDRAIARGASPDGVEAGSAAARTRKSPERRRRAPRQSRH